MDETDAKKDLRLQQLKCANKKCKTALSCWARDANKFHLAAQPCFWDRIIVAEYNGSAIKGACAEHSLSLGVCASLTPLGRTQAQTWCWPTECPSNLLFAIHKGMDYRQSVGSEEMTSIILLFVSYSA